MGSSSFPSCFRGAGGGAAAAATQKHSSSSSSSTVVVAPSSTTSVYETPLGLAALTWSRSLLGVSLRVDLRVPLLSSPSSSELPPHHHHPLSSPAHSPSSSSTTDQHAYPLTSLRFHLRPLLPWRRRGSRRFRFRHPSRTVDFAWDLSRAAFRPGASPEPRSRFSLSASLDGELLLAAGDRVPPLDPNPFLLASRIEHVVLPSSSSYATSVAVAGAGASAPPSSFISLQRAVALEVRLFAICLPMGAPKQKWTQEEEAALRAGVVKHGAGKWRTILKDPEFSGVLCLRSNVDLKDKWRNLSVTANGWSSRERGRLASKKSQAVIKSDDNPLAISTIVEDSADAILDAKSLQISHEALPNPTPKKPQSRVENLILEAIMSLNEPTGSNKTAISEYIEDQYWSPPNFKQLLSFKLKALTASGKLIKVKRKYRIAPSLGFPDQRGSKSQAPLVSQKEPVKEEAKEIKLLTKSQIDAELEKIRNMTAQEAAAAAARAVAEAEAAIAEAESAAREAEAAEADAEAAQAFALAAMDTLKGRTSGKNMMVRA